MLEDDIKNAFSSPKELENRFRDFPYLIRETIAYYENYKRGIMDTMKKYPQIVPPKAKKILAKYHKS